MRKRKRKRLILDLLSFSERPCPSLSLCVTLQADVWVLLGRARVREGYVLAGFWNHVLFTVAIQNCLDKGVRLS